MSEKAAQVIIVGAGVSGLVAARVLEQHNISPLVLEATESVGGRVKTSAVNGYQLDHGFQVLLTAYPMAQKYLDYNALNLRYFRPGALLFSNDMRQLLGDPLRDGGSLIPTLTSTAASFSDKWKIFKLTLKLKGKTLDSIFSEPETTTATYLETYGFSKAVIRNFFKPFFSGIFLEDELRTSSRMFEFVFKMFAEGKAAIPKAGIGAISEQLQNQLQQTTFQFNTEVLKVKDGTVFLANGEELQADFVISCLPSKPLDWKSCENFYFKVDEGKLPSNLIGLLCESDTLVNNINMHKIEGQEAIVSLTVVKKHGLSERELEQKIRFELESQCSIRLGKLIHKFEIKKALPDLEGLLNYPTNNQQHAKTILAGDHTANSSLNAAMASGEAAALKVLQLLNVSA